MRVSRREFTLLTASLLTAGSVGCVTVSDNGAMVPKQKSFMERMPWASKKDKLPEPYPNPVKVATTWTPDTLVQAGRTPTRGFGGRVFFYDEKSRPVPVEGTLVVHGFDDLAESQDNRVKRFEFTPEQFTNHFSQSDLGASYSIWIPWDAIGGDQRKIALVTSFQTATGKTVQGVPATIVLPGAQPEAEKLNTALKLSPQYQEYQQAQASNQPPSSGLTTTTIRRRRIRAGERINRTPGIQVPTLESDSMIARQTPSLDVPRTNRKSPSTILPTSAEMPLRR